MQRHLYYSILAVSLTVTTDCFAHHSRANFELDRVIGFRATVTRYQFTNPHSYLYVEKLTSRGEVENWVVELGSIPNLRRMNMGADALREGDVVMVRGNPERDPDRKYMFLVSVTTDDGREFAMDDVFSKGRKIREHGAEQPGSRDFSGKWYMMFSRGAVLAGSGVPDYPATEAGKALLARFNPDDDPFYSCINPGLPRMAGSPYALVIERKDERTILFKYEFPALERVIRLGVESKTGDTKPATLGHSRGRFDGETLVIETNNFSPETWGIGPGLDSSDQKTVTERYSLAEEGRLLRLHLTVTDPVYLSKPYERDYSWRHAPDYEITEYVDCDLEAAGKHLELEK